MNITNRSLYLLALTALICWVRTSPELPLAFTTNGQKVPDDLHPAVAQSLLAEIIRTYKYALSKAGQQEAGAAMLMS